MPTPVDEQVLSEYSKRGGRARGSVWDGVVEHLLSQKPGQSFEYVNGTDFNYTPRVRKDDQGNELPPTHAGESARGVLAQAVKDKFGDNYAVTVLTRPDARDRFVARINKLTAKEIQARQERVEKARKTMAERGTRPGRQSQSTPAEGNGQG